MNSSPLGFVCERGKWRTFYSKQRQTQRTGWTGLWTLDSSADGKSLAVDQNKPLMVPTKYQAGLGFPWPDAWCSLCGTEPAGSNASSSFIYTSVVTCLKLFSEPRSSSQVSLEYQGHCYKISKRMVWMLKENTVAHYSPNMRSLLIRTCVTSVRRCERFDSRRDTFGFGKIQTNL